MNIPSYLLYWNRECACIFTMLFKYGNDKSSDAMNDLSVSMSCDNQNTLTCMCSLPILAYC